MTKQGDIRAYLQVLWRWKLLVLGFVVVIPSVVYLLVSSQSKVYESSALMQVQPLAVDTTLFNTGSPPPDAQTLLSAARLITTTGVARAAAQNLGEAGTTAADLLSTVTVTPDVSANFITISARAGTPNRAAAVANAFAEAVVTTRTQQAVDRLDSTISKVSGQLRQLQRRDRDGRRQLSQELQRLRALKAAQGSNANIVEPAVPTASPVAPKVTRTVILAAIVALLLAFAAVVLAQGADRRIRDPLELEEITDRPMLSAIPRTASGEVQISGAGEEAFRTLHASLTYFNIDQPIRSVMVTSPVQGDGKTTVATNLAFAAARAGTDAILVDTDLRRPQVASRFDLEGSLGLGAVLVGAATLQESLVEAEVATPEGGRLRVLPAGAPPPNPSALLASQRMKDLLDETIEIADLVIVDSSPLLTVSDSLPLVEHVSGIVVVARLNETPKDAIRRLGRIIDSAGGTVLGSVVTGATTTGAYGRYGYGGYGYHGASSDGVGPASRRRRRSLWLRGRRKHRDRTRVEESPSLRSNRQPSSTPPVRSGAGSHEEV